MSFLWKGQVIIDGYIRDSFKFFLIVLSLAISGLEAFAVEDQQILDFLITKSQILFSHVEDFKDAAEGSTYRWSSSRDVDMVSDSFQDC